jgi:hypothetical protein
LLGAYIKFCELYFLEKKLVIISLGAGAAWVGIKKPDLNDLAIIMLRAFRMLKERYPKTFQVCWARGIHH